MSTNATQPSTDEQLAIKARAGSLASFDELARRLQCPLVGFLERRFPSRRDAEDVAQETLLHAYKSLASYQDGRRFRTWVFTIAFRLAISRSRSEHATERLEDFAARHEHPADEIVRREQAEQLWATVRSVLSEPQVMALWLYYVEALPAPEIARIMGRSWVSVKTMLHRARKKLEPHLTMEAVSAGTGGSR